MNFADEVRDAHPGQLRLIDAYHGDSVRLRVKCLVCGRFMVRLPEELLSATPCERCAPIEKLDATRYRRQLDGYGVALCERYRSFTAEMLHRCREHGHKFRLAPRAMQFVRGCPLCRFPTRYRNGRGGFDRSKPATLYYVRIDLGDGTVIYKLGVTGGSLSTRFRACDLERMTVLRVWSFGVGSHALAFETQLRRDHAADLLRPDEPVLASGGDSELFAHDVLDLDPDADDGPRTYLPSAALLEACAELIA